MSPVQQFGRKLYTDSSFRKDMINSEVEPQQLLAYAQMAEQMQAPPPMGIADVMGMFGGGQGTAPQAPAEQPPAQPQAGQPPAAPGVPPITQEQLDAIPETIRRPDLPAGETQVQPTAGAVQEAVTGRAPAPVGDARPNVTATFDEQGRVTGFRVKPPDQETPPGAVYTAEQLRIKEQQGLAPDQMIPVPGSPGEFRVESFSPVEEERPRARQSVTLVDPDTGKKTRGSFDPDKGRYFIREEGKEVPAPSNLVPEGGGDTVSVSVGGEELSPGEEQADKEAAKVLGEWDRGARYRAEGNIETIDEVTTGLRAGTINTASAIDIFVPQSFGMSDYVRSLANPESQKALRKIEYVVFQTLRDTLGAQFTEQEGRRLISATYDPRLPEKDNIELLDNATKALRRTVAAKNAQSQYFSENGTLRGFRGSDPYQTFQQQLQALNEERNRRLNREGYNEGRDATQDEDESGTFTIQEIEE